MYPTLMTKLEMRYAISQLERFISNWTCEHWNLAIGCLKYGCTTRWYGVIYSIGLDKHGVNVLMPMRTVHFLTRTATGEGP